MRAADAVLDRQVLHRLHEERDPIHLCKFRLEPTNHVRSRNAALLERFQVDLDAPAVDGRVRAVNADEGRKAFDGRILQDHTRESLLALRHREE